MLESVQGVATIEKIRVLKGLKSNANYFVKLMPGFAKDGRQVLGINMCGLDPYCAMLKERHMQRSSGSFLNVNFPCAQDCTEASMS